MIVPRADVRPTFGETITLTALLPAAGRATRLQPLAVSKEMVTVHGRPMIDYVTEVLLAAEPDEVRVITRPEKKDVREHASKLGWTTLLGHPEHVAASLAIGLGGLADDGVVIIGFPDTLVGPPDAAIRTVGALIGTADAALGLFHFPEPARGDLVTLGDTGVVTSVRPKPQDPEGNLVWGLVAVRVGPLAAGLPTVREPGDLWDRWAREGRVTGVDLGSEYIDVGTRDSLNAVDPQALGQADPQFSADPSR